MEIDGDVDIRPQPFPHHLQRCHRAADLGVGLDPFVISRNARFEARDALLDRRCPQLRQLVPGAGVGVIVAAHAARIDGAAQQLVHGHSQDLAPNVPQRLVDARDGRPHHRTGPVEALHVHRLPQVLHLHGVRADQEIAEVVDAGHHRARFALQGSFAPSHHALVRFDLHENVRAVRIARQRDAEDFQAADRDARAQPSKRVAAGRLRRQRAAAQVRGPAPAACRPSQARTAQRQKSSTLHGISPEPLRSP